ncbi:pyridoxal-phosphate dependent enzyme [Flavobacterium psychrophilum]|uniref:1-aminocyclopropane-1-carboxylate deaminase/D-cysteine desulfhydrase n=1 Tax=Flavobacterium psychrophilum TaxID=96345 RepID=UPI000903E6D3|nr:pyridoxal-phosphate dependent enzyme [Flavobacterium psychrophilum]MCB5980636.1 pyridoxal-phosphate dependent enzyme [Flavobacterium psychrophilum]MCB6010937.1 pyridoxal-phosphate dependent enzyme [Flavobacterium psychrophilum]MCB6015956.1 pyridoxal-phosphate dependent enzyme [Flavobacterium psychrophilum]MCB6023421.1 pyridoxal-phosphate dependent enzyme [Flavobacterium psychrophilum]MCB6028491.1 pyridoxal-phosphate dependent enzyme [Flavobacterium psychrophilum]
MLSINQNIETQNSTITLTIKREDLLHPFVSGNKFRKLKYNILDAKNNNCKKLITFGGAFSNHIAAVAFACKEEGIKSVGIIRGDELLDKIPSNPTLLFAQNCGMKFEFVSREVYQNKMTESFISALNARHENYYLLPEGGTNELAVLGCKEILTSEDSHFDYICCAVGTGGTISGIINSANLNQKIIGFPALKGDFLKDEIRKFAKNNNWELNNNYHFGGYGKVTDELIGFINQFYIDTNIPLDPIYTGKMVYGVMHLLANNYFPDGSKILMIHTGGLQGISGMNELLEKKRKKKIVFDE